MPLKEHPDYLEELQRLEYTLDYVEKSLENAIHEKDRLDVEVSKSKKGLSDDSSQGYIDLMINTMFHDRIQIKLKNLNAARKKPYFARIDFKENNSAEKEKIYIGKMSLMREEDQKLIIVDWRAPISNLYYEERIGDASYSCPEGRIKGKLSLKRQFSIDVGKLNNIFDIDITTNDEFLQSYLGANADNRLKDIVSTIQVEQNRVIRADMWKPLIVQGAAGSGKTTIALHRIAYLIYTFEKSFEPENFMILAPTRFFLNYISEVLPELGVDRVKQTTYQDFALEMIGGKLKIADENEKLIRFVDNNNTEEEIELNNLIRSESEFKASIEFRKIMDAYLEKIEKDFLPKMDFTVGNYVIYKYDEIQSLFLNEYKNLSMHKRVLEIKKHLSNRLKQKKDSIRASFQFECDRKVAAVKRDMEDCEERRKILSEIIDSKNESISKLESICKKAVNDYVKSISKIEPLKYYREFFENEELFLSLMGNCLNKNEAEFLRKYTIDILNKGFVEIEDLAPIMYIKYCVYGIDEKINVKHIVVDEAQDFSVFQFYVLKKIAKDTSLTILGDLCQGIHSYRGIKSWRDVQNYVFEDKKCEIVNLEQSYRTTVEIMNAANSVITKIKDENIIPGKPVIRHGDKVEIIKKESLQDTAKDISSKINELKKDGFKSIAVICKTIDECMKMNTLLKKYHKDIQLLTGKEKEYKAGIVIVPSYFSKGLEFDAVMIANADSDKYTENELDIKLLYVSMTRPLHKLYIYYEKNPSALLNDIK
ncbi:DNA helicase-2 / ATP-dependent DNA helicase PcrA [Caloramator quimbayensis]|uniref:DNA 3'-5' helicase n=1 Tax=Caloramator quimbayensis TaxID=1147123 RepID=A0A1T4XUF2_9CLOT|nr:RNA polymerase recycling motor HelD [Caloramator quimbayensis]SKA93033.1 DNA helicase-2 / ATP-dependent DNA helicase PcrA [Caloramator quimbayensis]